MSCRQSNTATKIVIFAREIFCFRHIECNAISQASSALPVALTDPSVTNSDGAITPKARLIVLLLNVSPTSAALRPARPRRTPVSAFGMLVSGASTSTPSTAREMCRLSPSVSPAWTMPALPATISPTSTTISASRPRTG